MNIADLLLAEGIAAAKAGAKGTARQILVQAVRRQPHSVEAWLWLSSVLSTPQGRAHCLQQVLDLNPDHRAARIGLAALEGLPPARAIVVRPAETKEEIPAQPAVPATPSTPSEPAAPVAVKGVAQPGLLYRKRFWQGVVACLAVVALSLFGVLAYTVSAGGSDSTAQRAQIVGLAATLEPGATLRPTFTSTPSPSPAPTDTSTPPPTWTPSPTPTPTETATPAPTETATPTPTETATATPSRAVARQVPAPTRAPAPRPTLPPRNWDPRLEALGVRLEPAAVASGQRYWRLVEARWADEGQSAGRHSIFVNLLDAQGGCAVGQPVLVQWADGQVALIIEDRPATDWGADFGMYNTLGSYAVCVGGTPSDRVVGLGLGTADAPSFTVHTSFYLTFQLVCR